MPFVAHLDGGMCEEGHGAATVERLKAAFLSWLEETRPQCVVPIHVKGIKPDRVEFDFAGWPTALRGWVGHRANSSGSELLVDAEYEEIWDGLLWPDAVRPERRATGWICATCEHEGRHRLFSSPEAIWRDHMFDPLLTWINQTLAFATAVAFYENNGATWVELLTTNLHQATHVLMPTRKPSGD